MRRLRHARHGTCYYRPEEGPDPTAPKIQHRCHTPHTQLLTRQMSYLTHNTRCHYLHNRQVMIFALPFGHMLVFGAIPAFWLRFLAVTFTAGVYGMTLFFRRRSASVMMHKYEIAAALLARGTARDELKEIQAEVRANAGVDGDQSFGRRGRRVHPQDNVADPEDASMQCTQGAEGAGGASAQLTQAAAPI